MVTNNLFNFIFLFILFLLIPIWTFYGDKMEIIANCKKFKVGWQELFHIKMYHDPIFWSLIVSALINLVGVINTLLSGEAWQ